MMQISTGQVKHLPLSASQEAMGEEVSMIGWSANRLDRSTSAYNHRSLHSACLRMAVVVHKLSNSLTEHTVKQHSLTVLASRLGHTLDHKATQVGGHPPEGVRYII